MGKLAITGKAEREICYDIMELTVTFTASGSTSAEALDIVMQQSEDFLAVLADGGVDLTTVHLDENTLDKNRYSGEEIFEATRSVMFRVGFDMQTINRLNELIRSKNYLATLSAEYLLSNRAALYRQLLKDALTDSRRQAEMIAETMGQTITGIDSVTKYPSCAAGIHLCEGNDSWIFQDLVRPLLSNHLAAPRATESETIEVVWLIE